MAVLPRVALVWVLVFGGLAACTPSIPAVAPTPTPTGPYEVLVFTKTAAFHHDSIPAGIAAIQALGEASGFTVVTTDDGGSFSSAALARFATVVFLATTGDVLDLDQQAAFEAYIRGGGGFVGVHSAADTEYDWPWYGRLVGAYFNQHPVSQPAVVRVEDRAHPSTAHLDPLWTRTEEWYNFRTNPRGTVHVLATVDETTYAPGPGAMGADHPIAWYHEFEGGRSFYTGFGHAAETYDDPAFRAHLLGGIQYTARVA